MVTAGRAGSEGRREPEGRGSLEVKICGCTRPVDVRTAARAGASHVGFVFAPSPRRVSVREAEALVSVLRDLDPVPDVRCVGVFVDEEPEAIRTVAARAGLQVVQLHGGESPGACERLREWGLEVWKVLRPRSREELAAGVGRFAGRASALVVEGHSGAAAGGTGTAVPWGWLEVLRAGDREPPRFLLAGGLDPENVAEAVTRTRPAGVDVSSGVERAPGEKDPERIRRFVARARAAAG